MCPESRETVTLSLGANTARLAGHTQGMQDTTSRGCQCDHKPWNGLVDRVSMRNFAWTELKVTVSRLSGPICIRGHGTYGAHDPLRPRQETGSGIRDCRRRRHLLSLLGSLPSILSFVVCTSTGLTRPSFTNKAVIHNTVSFPSAAFNKT